MGPPTGGAAPGYPPGAVAQSAMSTPRSLSVVRDGDDGPRQPKAPRKEKRAGVFLDKYSIFQLGREYSLSAHECWLLEALSHLCDFRSRSFAGTLGELSEDTRIGKNTIRGVLDGLCDKGLVRETRPFGNRQTGEVEVVCWARLVVTRDETISQKWEREAPVESPKIGSVTDEEISHQSPSNFPVISQSWEIQQPKEGLLRNKAIREGKVGSQQIQEVQSFQETEVQSSQKIDSGDVVVPCCGKVFAECECPF